MKKSSNISVTALHRFIPQPASGRSSALPCLDCIFSMVRILAIIAFTRLFFHTQQCRLVRIAFQVEILQSGLRKKIVKMIKVSATRDFDGAILLINECIQQIEQERTNAEEAIEIVKQLLSDYTQPYTHCLKRKEVSDALNISMDALRNWEMNGLLTVKRKENGYRVYTNEDIQRLKIIRSLFEMCQLFVGSYFASFTAIR